MKTPRTGAAATGGIRDSAFRLLLPTVVAALTIAYYAVPWQAHVTLGVAFVVAYTWLLPGLALRRLLRSVTVDYIEATAGGLAFGIAFVLLLAFGAALAGVSLTAFENALPALIMLLAIYAWRFPPAEARAGGNSTHPAPAPLAPGAAKAWRVVMIAVTAAAFVLVLRSGAPVDHTKDTLDHAAYIAEVAQTGEAFPRSEFYIDAGDNGRDIRKGLLHYFYGYVVRFLALDAFAAIDALNAVLAATMLLVIYALVVTFTRDPAIATLAAVTYLLTSAGGFGGSAMRVSFYPNRAGAIFFLFLLIHGLEYLSVGRRVRLAGCALFAFAACATHVFYAVVVVCSGLVVLVWKTCFARRTWREHISRVVPIGLAAMAGVLPYAIYRWVTASPQANDLHTEIQGVVFVSKHLYVADPIKLYRTAGVTGGLALLAAWALWRERRRNPLVGYAIAAILTVPLVLLNPIVLPLLHRAMTYLVFRLPAIAPYYVLIAVLVVDTLRRAKGRDGLRPAHLVLTGLILITLAAAIRPLAGADVFSRQRHEREHAASYKAWEQDLEALPSAGEAPVVVASDPITSYTITALTPHHVVCTLDQHAPPNDLRLTERIEAARDILSPYVAMSRKAELIRRERATHIVLNNRPAARKRLHYWSMNDAAFEATKAQLERHPDIAKTYDENGFVIFECAGASAADGDPPDNPYFLHEVPDTFGKVGAIAGEATLDAARFDRAEVERGGSLAGAFVWSTDREHWLDNYTVSIRFDHVAPALPFGGRPFPKVARKLKEAVSGERYRFRAEHKIQSGFLSPDTWPRGQLVLDDWKLTVPSNLAAGEYVVSVKLLTLTNQTNYRLRDYFYDDDVFAGVETARIVVR